MNRHPDEVLTELAQFKDTLTEDCEGHTYQGGYCKGCVFEVYCGQLDLIRDATELIRDLQAAEITNEKIIGQLEREIEDLKQQLAWRDEPDDAESWRD